MASKQKRAARTTNNTSVVVRNGPAPSGASRRRRRRRAPRKPKIVVLPSTQKVQVPRVRSRGKGINNNVVRQRITTTLGTIGANSNGEIETEMTMIINPATMKESTASNAYGPLNIYASTYSLWRLAYMDVKLTPLIGSSAISGTMVRVSYNPTNSPTMTSWSAIGARYHIDATPGQHVKFHIDGRKLKGCKDGWYKTNTTGDPMMSFAGVVEAHSIGQTKSTYKNENYEGPLFMVEVTSEWEFTAYAQQPGLLNLKKGTDDTNATVTTDSDGKLQMVLPPTSRLARAVTPTQPSEIIWMVADTVFTAGASAFPPPFSWLLRGGWWLLKRAAGAPVLRHGGVTFDVYESIQNARAGVPCLTTVPDGNWPVGKLHYTQLTPGNIGIEETPPVQRMLQPAPSTQPSLTFVVSSRRFKFNAEEMVPSFPVFYHLSNGNQNPETGLGFKADGIKVPTYNVMEVEITNDIGDTNPDLYPNKLPVYLFYENQERLVGFAVASRYDTQSDNQLRYTVYTLLVRATVTERYRYHEQWKGTMINYPVDDQYRTQISTPDDSAEGFVRVEFVAGRWYLIQYMYTGSADRYYIAGDDRVAQHASSNLTPGRVTIPTRIQDSSKALLNVYGPCFQLRTLTSSEAHVEAQLEGNAAAMTSDLSGLSLASDDLEMDPEDHYSDPPMSRLYVRPAVEDIYKMVLDRGGTERQARLAANQVDPSDDYIRFIEMYHDAIADGMSPEGARRYALGL